jgi:transposase InsO family protein
LVKGLPNFKKENSKCEDCIFGKEKGEAFPTRSWQATKYLELIHSDICGPRESSFGGCRYFILFIDEHTRMTWVFFLKEKYEAFEKFVNFQHMVENETREKVASLRIDNGSEFTSTEFNDDCRNNGIRRKLKNSYTPEKNGVTERMNKTLMSMEISMMQFKGLSTKYWDEAVHTAVYLRNRSPTSDLDGKTPYEAWYGFKPKVNHLRVFGSTC